MILLLDVRQPLAAVAAECIGIPQLGAAVVANAERYITEELKEYEEKILGAEEKMLVLEQRIYAEHNSIG